MTISSNPALWKVFLDGVCVDNPDLYYDDLVVSDIEIDTETNAHGSMSFTVPVSNPKYEIAGRIGAIVTATNGGEEMFRGRVAETSLNMYNSLSVYCEGQLAFLCDSIIQPFAFKGSVQEFLKFILDTHNSCVDSTRQFSLGTVTVTDPDNNGVLVRSSDSAISSWEAISGRLLDPLGGYLMVRKSGDTYYIDYLKELTEKSGQTVAFGENLLNIERYINSDNIVTVLYPFGAKIEEDGTNENSSDKYMEEPEESGITLWHGNRVTIRSVNSGKMYVENSSGVETWGRICGTNVWDDVTEPSNLLRKANEWLADSILSTTTITLNAVDLHLVDADIDDIRLGDLVHVRSTVHDIDTWLPCIKTHIEPGAPDKNEITLGASVSSLTTSIAKDVRQQTTVDEVVKTVWKRMTAAEGVAT